MSEEGQLHLNEHDHRQHSQEQQDDENGHHIRSVLLRDKRRERAEAAHHEARMTAEDHVATRLKGSGVEDQVVRALHRLPERQDVRLHESRLTIKDHATSLEGYRLVGLSGLGSERWVMQKVSGRK